MKILLILAFLISLNTFSLCQNFWEETAGPEGGLTQCLALDKDSNLYAGFNAGWFGPTHLGNCFYKTSDEGMTWQSLSIYSNKDVQSIVIDTSGTIFLWEGGVGVLKSTNGGLNWILTSGGIEGLYDAVLGVCSNNYVIIGHYYGIYISTNSGDDWNLTSLTEQIKTVFVDSYDNIFAGTVNGSLYKSSDYGSTWYPADNGLTGNPVNAFTQSNDTTYYAGTGIGIFKSTDNCVSWSFQNGSPANVTTMASANTNVVFAGTSKDGVFLTTDEGHEWQERSPSLQNLYITSLVILPSRKVVIGTYGDGMFVSLTQGQCWQWLNNGVRSVHVTSMINFNGDLFTGSQQGMLYKSTDRGDSWIRIDSTYTHMPVTAFLSTRKNSLFFASWYSPFSQEYSSGKQQDKDFLRKQRTVLHRDSIYGKVFKSEDEGNTWRETAQLYVNSFASYYDAATYTEYLIAAADYQGIMISTDDGSSWYPANNGIEGYLEDIETSSLGLFFASSSNLIFRSSDFGQSWETIYNGDSLSIFHTTLDISPNGYLYAGFDWGTILLSTDNGDTWADIGQDLPIIRINSITTDSLNRIYVGSWDGLIFQSLDYGENWIDISSGMIGGPIFNLNCDNSGNIFVGPYGGGIFRGVNNTFVPPQVNLAYPGPGAQNIPLTPILKWHSSPTANLYRVQVSLTGDFDSAGIVFDTVVNDTSCAVDSLELNTRYHWRISCSNQYGWSIWSVSWWFKTIDLTSVGQDTKVVYTFNLLQNYPNPFNPVTTIRYSVPNIDNSDVQQVRLMVYDILGNEVITLVNEEKHAGIYEAKLDGSRLSSGMYLYRLTVGKFTAVKKLLLLK